MEVFISWSGERSKIFAESLRNWLPKIINAVKPWLSSADIDKGARWSADVAAKLEASRIGIICLTPSNMHSDWVLFEAGALSKTITKTHVCPMLIGLEPSDVSGPLAQFQATRAKKDEIKKLMATINAALGENALPDAHLAEAFEMWWPKLDDVLRALPPDIDVAKPHRSERDLLEEILALVRSQARDSDTPLADRLYTPGHALRRVARAFDLVRVESAHGDGIKSWKVEQDGDLINLSVVTDRGNFSVQFPTSFQPMDAIRGAIVDRLARLTGTSVDLPGRSKEASDSDSPKTTRPGRPGRRRR